MNIIVNSKEYPLQWGMGALEIYCDLMDCDLDGLAMIEDKSKPLLMQKAIQALIFAAVKNGCEVNEQECDLSLPKLRVALDDMEQSSFQGIMDDFINSKYLGKTLREHLFGDVVVQKKSKKPSPSVKQ